MQVSSTQAAVPEPVQPRQSLRFRRPATPGTEWLAVPRSGGGTSIRTLLATLVAQEPNMSLEGHVSIGFALLRRASRAGASISALVLHRVVTHLKPCLDVHPEEPILWRAMGTTHVLAGRFEEGVEALCRCQIYAPDNAADVELDMRRLCLFTDTARGLRVLKERPEVDLPDNAKRAAYAATLHRALGDDATAFEVLQTARQRWPSDLALHIEWAQALWDRRDRAAAIGELAAIRAERQPTSPCVTWNFIAALAAIGDLESARQMLEEAEPSVAADPALALAVAPTSDAPPVDRLAADTPLSGDVAAFAMSDFISFLGQVRATGVLTVRASWGTCALHYDRGDLVDAVLPASAAEDMYGDDSKPSRASFDARIDRSAGATRLTAKVQHAVRFMVQAKVGQFQFFRLDRRSVAPRQPRVDTQRSLREVRTALDARRAASV